MGFTKTEAEEEEEAQEAAAANECRSKLWGNLLSCPRLH